MSSVALWRCRARQRGAASSCFLPPFVPCEVFLWSQAQVGSHLAGCQRSGAAACAGTSAAGRPGRTGPLQGLRSQSLVCSSADELRPCQVFFFCNQKEAASAARSLPEQTASALCWRRGQCTWLEPPAFCSARLVLGGERRVNGGCQRWLLHRWNWEQPVAGPADILPRNPSSPCSAQPAALMFSLAYRFCLLVLSAALPSRAP